MSSIVSYPDMITKETVEQWANERGLVAEHQIALHMKERFGARHIVVNSADTQDGFLILHLTTDQWTEPREFALLADGSLSW
jgi:hypothetical protein